MVHLVLRHLSRNGNCRLLIFALLTGMMGYFSLVASATSLPPVNCEISQSTYDSDMQFVNQHGPTLLRLMGSRYVDLRRTARGLSCSGMPLVEFDGLRYLRAGQEDDPGIYYVVPELARILGVSLETAIDLTLIGTVLLASGIGLLGFMRMARTTLGRRTGIIGFLLLTIVVLIAGDVYVMNAAPAIACVPWILYFGSRRKLTASAAVTFAMVGLFSKLADFFRAYAGTAVVLFALVALAGLYQLKPVGRVLLVAALVVGGASVQMFLRELYSQRSAFLGRRAAAYEATQVHPFWHSVYIGLGYIKNSEIPAYRDEVAIAKVRLLRPNAAYLSSEYEQVLKKETLELAKRRPLLILENLLVKLAVVLFYCICAANVGLYAATVARKPIWFELAFWGPVGFSALFGILVVPNPKYLLGMIAFAALYGLYSIACAAEDPQLLGKPAWIGRVVGVPSYHQSSGTRA